MDVATTVNPALVFVFVLFALIPAIGSVIQFRKNYAVRSWYSIHTTKLIGTVMALTVILMVLLPNI